MALRADDHAEGGATLYEWLRDDEENKFSRRGGERRLIGDKMVLSGKPNPRLVNLRRGEPATFYVWQLPKPARGIRDASERVVVHPDGLISDA